MRARTLVGLTACLALLASCLEPEGDGGGDDPVVVGEDPQGTGGDSAGSGEVCEGALVTRRQMRVTASGQSMTVDTLQGAESVEQFYSYGDPDKWSANTGLEYPDRMTLIPYQEPDGRSSLVLILDQPGDGSGGVVELATDGSLDGADITVFDDPNSSGDWFDPVTGIIHFTWYKCCTDGMAVTMEPPPTAGAGDQTSTDCLTFALAQMSGVDGIDLVDPRGDRHAVDTSDGLVEVCMIESTCCPSEEVCDGVDNDCDGEVDEGLEAQPTTCGVGACQRDGFLFCADGELYDSCLAGDPAADDASCDGVDDDCDGAADEDHVATPTSCGEAPCFATGELACLDGGVVDTCDAPIYGAEVCDGVDNDCDGETDEDPTGLCEDAPGCEYGTCWCISGACVLE